MLELSVIFVTNGLGEGLLIGLAKHYPYNNNCLHQHSTGSSAVLYFLTMNLLDNMAPATVPYSVLFKELELIIQLPLHP